MGAGLGRQVSPKGRAEADSVGCGLWSWEVALAGGEAAGAKSREVKTQMQCSWNLGWGCSDFPFSALWVGMGGLVLHFLPQPCSLQGLTPQSRYWDPYPRQQGWSCATGSWAASCPPVLLPPLPQAPPRHRSHLCVTPMAWLIGVGLASVHCLGVCFTPSVMFRLLAGGGSVSCCFGIRLGFIDSFHVARPCAMFLNYTVVDLYPLG